MAYGPEIFDLTGKVGVVTGGATGIGLSIAKGLAAFGASVVVASRNRERLEKAVTEIVAETGNDRVDFCQVDLARRDETETVVQRVVSRFGRLDIVVGNAGQDVLEPIESFSDEGLDLQLEVNLASNIVLTRAAVPEFRKVGGGRIVFVSSQSAYIAATDGVGIYSATKAGLHGFAQVAALELGPIGVTVNCVAPGFTMTPMLEEFIDSLGELGIRERDTSAKTTAMNRWGRPDEMVGAVLLLVSDAGSFMTGTVVKVDGGTTIRMK